MNNNDHLTAPMLSAAMDEVIRLRTRIEELEQARDTDLRVCAEQLEENTAAMDFARARIEALEAALWEILDAHDRSDVNDIARDALDKDVSK